MAVAQALGKRSGTDLLTDTAVVRSSEITEKLLCLLVMKPAKQLAATWSVHTPKQKNATGEVAVPSHVSSRFIWWENLPIPMLLQRRRKLLLNMILHSRLENNFPELIPTQWSFKILVLWSTFKNVSISHVWISVLGRHLWTEELNPECYIGAATGNISLGTLINKLQIITTALSTTDG